MSKKDVEPKAKELYVIHQLTLAEISRELKVSTRTLQNWKAAGEWDLERTRLGTSESYCHHSLFRHRRNQDQENQAGRTQRSSRFQPARCRPGTLHQCSRKVP